MADVFPPRLSARAVQPAMCCCKLFVERTGIITPCQSSSSGEVVGYRKPYSAGWPVMAFVSSYRRPLQANYALRTQHRRNQRVRPQWNWRFNRHPMRRIRGPSPTSPSSGSARGRRSAQLCPATTGSTRHLEGDAWSWMLWRRTPTSQLAEDPGCCDTTVTAPIPGRADKREGVSGGPAILPAGPNRRRGRSRCRPWASYQRGDQPRWAAAPMSA